MPADDQEQFESDQREVFGVPLLARYRHCYGMVVRLVCAGRHFISGKQYYAYQDETTKGIYHIPASEFNGKVLIAGKEVDRFTRIYDD